MKREGMDRRMGKGTFAGGGDFAGAVLFLLASAAFGQLHGALPCGRGYCADEPRNGDDGAV